MTAITNRNRALASCLAALVITACSQPDADVELVERIDPPASAPSETDSERWELLDYVRSDERRADPDREVRRVEIAAEYMTILAAEAARLEAFSATPPAGGVAEIRVVLDQFDDWARLYENGINRELDDSQEALRQGFGRALATTQINTLPRLRRVYAADLDIASMGCATTGDRAVYLLCTDVAFRHVDGINHVHNRLRAELTRLRFQEGRYRSYEMIGGTFFNRFLESPADDAVTIWTGPATHRLAY